MIDEQASHCSMIDANGRSLDDVFFYDLVHINLHDLFLLSAGAKMMRKKTHVVKRKPIQNRFRVVFFHVGMYFMHKKAIQVCTVKSCKYSNFYSIPLIDPFGLNHFLYFTEKFIGIWF